MSQDYLWDGSGTPDPEVEKFEQALGGLRYDEPLQAVAPRRFGRRPAVLAMAAAAVLVLAVGLTTWLTRGDNTKRGGGSPPAPVATACVPGSGEHDAAWRVQTVAGAPRCGGDVVGADVRLKEGGWLETDATSRARIQVADIGQVELDPNSRLRLVTTKDTEHRLELAKGRISAVIDAPPRLFLVDTPAGTAVDLGCAYTLEVDAKGVSHLEVTAGYVAVAHKGRETLVPAGYLSESRPGEGPIPTIANTASPALRAAVRTYAYDGKSDAAFEAILREATPADTITLWHMLPLATAAQCPRLDERLTALAGRPAGAVWGANRCDESSVAAWRGALEPTWMGGSMGRWLDDAVKRSRQNVAPK